MSDGHERRLSDLYRASAREVPPAAIDNAILAAARHEARRSTRVGIRWGVPLALAAVVVLSVSLVTLMRDASELSGESMNVEGQRQALPAPAEADKPSAIANESEQMRRPGLQEGSNTEQTAADKLRSEPAKSDAQQSAPIPAPARARVNANGALDATSAENRKSKAVAAGRTASGPAVGTAAEEAPRSDARADNALSPEEWLKRIERLRKEGKAAEAQVSFEEFRRRYPAYPLPETLK